MLTNLLTRLKRIFLRSKDVPTQVGSYNDDVNRRISELSRALDYNIREYGYFVQALKHRSFLSVANEERNNSYERLEFLGDAVLELLVTEYLFQAFPDHDEGELTKIKSLLVSKKHLYPKAERLSLGRFVLMSDGERKSGGMTKKSILADCLESIIGAIYLDGGYSAAKDFVYRHILDNDEISDIAVNKMFNNFKGELLEFAQARGLSVPEYLVAEERGPDHNKSFTIQVRIGNDQFGTGTGNNKKGAEQEAARAALRNLRVRENEASDPENRSY